MNQYSSLTVAVISVFCKFENLSPQELLILLQSTMKLGTMNQIAQGYCQRSMYGIFSARWLIYSHCNNIPQLSLSRYARVVSIMEKSVSDITVHSLNVCIYISGMCTFVQIEN